MTDPTTSTPMLPRSLDGLTAEWLGRALAGKYLGTEVTSVHFGTVIHGTATKIRLLLTYNEAGHRHRLPATMFAKCNFEAHSALIYECARSEAVFYRDRAPEVESWLNIPQCYFAGLDEQSGDAFLLLEDLLARNASFGFALRPVSFETARQAIIMLARYHARWWDSPGLMRRTVTAGADIVTDFWMNEENFGDRTRLPRFDYVPPELRDRGRFRDAVHKLWEINRSGPHCLLFGDLHLGNCFFDSDGTPGFLDLQGDTRGCWAHDFTEFVITSLAVDDRRAYERPLLEIYLETLRSFGGGVVPLEQAWKQYRQNVIWPATAAVCPVISQAEAVCTVHTERAMAAVVDLDVLASLEN